MKDMMFLKETQITILEGSYLCRDFFLLYFGTHMKIDYLKCGQNLYRPSRDLLLPYFLLYSTSKSEFPALFECQSS